MRSLRRPEGHLLGSAARPVDAAMAQSIAIADQPVAALPQQPLRNGAAGAPGIAEAAADDQELGLDRLKDPQRFLRAREIKVP
jgi:hypothetical protein